MSAPSPSGSRLPDVGAVLAAAGGLAAAGTPGGVGHARKPPVYLRAGDTVTTEIAGVGRTRNPVIRDGPQ